MASNIESTSALVQESSEGVTGTSLSIVDDQFASTVFLIEAQSDEVETEVEDRIEEVCIFVLP